MKRSGITVDESLAQLRADARDFIGGERIARPIRAAARRLQRVANFFDGHDEKRRIPTRLRRAIEQRLRPVARELGVTLEEAMGCVDDWQSSILDAGEDSEILYQAEAFVRFRAELGRFSRTTDPN